MSGIPKDILLREYDLLMMPERRGENVFCHACLGESMAVHTDGSVYPCGQTVGDLGFVAGNVWNPGLEDLQVWNGCRPGGAQCDKCPVEPFCPGDCPSRLYYNQGSCNTVVCDLYRALWHAVNASAVECRNRADEKDT